MTEFKVGDKVRRVRDVWSGAHMGGTVTGVYPSKLGGMSLEIDHGPGWFADNYVLDVIEEPVFGGVMDRSAINDPGVDSGKAESTPRTLVTAHGGPDFAGVAAELTLLLKERHEKYGPTNIANAYGGPMNGLLVRMGDKFARLQHGLDEHKDESVTDTLLDLAGYSLIALLVHRGEWPGVE